MSTTKLQKKKRSTLYSFHFQMNATRPKTSTTTILSNYIRISIGWQHSVKKPFKCFQSDNDLFNAMRYFQHAIQIDIKTNCLILNFNDTYDVPTQM